LQVKKRMEINGLKKCKVLIPTAASFTRKIGDFDKLAAALRDQLDSDLYMISADGSTIVPYAYVDREDLKSKIGKALDWRRELAEKHDRDNDPVIRPRPPPVDDQLLNLGIEQINEVFDDTWHLPQWIIDHQQELFGYVKWFNVNSLKRWLKRNGAERDKLGKEFIYDIQWIKDVLNNKIDPNNPDYEPGDDSD
jgi:hypothetical protein